MVFSHDAELALVCTAALINVGDDSLSQLDGLQDFLSQWSFPGARTHDGAELAAVRRLRKDLERIWCSPRDVAVPLINQLLERGDARPYLVRHDGWDWHLHATTADQPLHLRVAVESAMALVDVVRQDDWERIRVCAAPGCSHAVIDLSRNRSRRYCDAGCGNRVNVAAYRARATSS